MKINKDTWREFFYSLPEIFLDGMRVEHVIEADDVNRYVVIQEYENGAPRHDGEKFITKKLEGAVVFIGRRIGEP